MTVKIGMGSSALDLKDAKVWGYPASKIMVGTGTTAIEAWPGFEDQQLIYSTAGSHTLEVPPGARWAEIICLGGGGGGQGGDSALGKNGDGGGAGQWAANTFDLTGIATLPIVVGTGGNGGALGSNGFAGNTSYVYGSGISLTAGGGTLGTGWGNGQGDSAGTFQYQGKTYYGGAGGSRGNPGQIPGGGGGGGTGGFFGGGTRGYAGGHGRVIINLYSKKP